MKGIIEKYIAAATQYAEGTQLGDSKKTNVAFKKIDTLFRTLKNNNQLNLLMELTNHPHTAVRIWAATHLLPYNEDIGIKILEEIEKLHSNDIYGFDAKMTIKEWKKGNLTYLIE